MNSNHGKQVYIPSSSSDEEDDLTALMNHMAHLDEEDEAIERIIAMNRAMMDNMLQQQSNPPIHGGSVPRHAVIYRDRETAVHNLFVNYFAEIPRYNESMFRRRYRMSRSLFIRIVDAVKAHDVYFVQLADRCGKMGLSTLQKITAAFRMLAYGLPADATDEYIKIGESTAIESVKRFCRAIVELFTDRYLRKPTANDVARLLYIGQQRGFPGMLGSLDCMHWRWKNCPSAWAGQYSGRSGAPTIILEAVADYDTWR